MPPFAKVGSRLPAAATAPEGSPASDNANASHRKSTTRDSSTCMTELSPRVTALSVARMDSFICGRSFFPHGRMRRDVPSPDARRAMKRTVRALLAHGVERFEKARLSYGHGTTNALDEPAWLIL